MDVSWQNLLIVGAVVVFVGFLLWKYRPGWPPIVRAFSRATPGDRRHWADIEGEVRKAREEARRAATPRERAALLVRAADAAARGDHGVPAMGLYVRAMRADAASCDAIRGISELLRQDRPELLESVLWRRLAH